ncbi:MAG: DUF1587 domain-containing protein, partial [Proteobacteria bacterium]|nr:DUF1587 domain-containing protein [Pseudomonadota bacterium]
MDAGEIECHAIAGYSRSRAKSQGTILDHIEARIKGHIGLGLDIDAAALLPADESGHGFDNVTVGDLPPALLDRYISAAQKISRLAVGGAQTSLQSDVIRMPADRTQEEHVAGLPIGTRGGVSFSYNFAQDGEY